MNGTTTGTAIHTWGLSPVLAQVNQVTGTAGTEAGGGSAPAAAPPSPSGGIEQILFLVAIFGIFFFLIIRPQQKRAKKHRELVSSIQVGDRVITSGGMYGRIIEMDAATVLLEVDKNTRIRMLRSFVSTRQNEDAEKDAAAMREAA